MSRFERVLNKIKAFAGGSAFLIVILLLMVSMLTGVVTYAWISQNTKVASKNINMRYEVDNLQIGGVKIENGVITLVDPGTITGTSSGDENMIPGSVLTMKIGMANDSKASQTVTALGFQDANIWTTANGNYDAVDKEAFDEVPTKSDGKYYYLGTQLTVAVNHYTVYQYEEKQVEKDGVKQYNADGSPMMELVIVDTITSGDLTAMTPIVMTAVDTKTGAVTYPTLIRNDLSINLPTSCLVAFDVVVTFVESGVEQNVYQNFGVGNAKFSRTLSIDLEKSK